MSCLFKHIANDTLTADVLQNHLTEGCNIHGINKKGVTLLVYAYKKRRNDSIKLLLDHGADITVYEVDEDDDDEFFENGTLFDLARQDNNIEVLRLLIKDKARSNAIELQELQKNPVKYDEKAKQSIELYANLFDNNKEPDIRKTIEAIVATDSILQKYPQLHTLVKSISNLEYWIDFTGGNADDKIETATLELGVIGKHRLEYFCYYNWSYGGATVKLVWHQKMKKTPCTWKLHRNMIDDDRFSDKHKKSLRLLAQALLGSEGFCDMPLEHFVRFLIVLLSRKVQKKMETIEDHEIYLMF